MSVSQMFVGQMSVSEMFVDQMSIAQMSIGQMSVRYMTVFLMSAAECLLAKYLTVTRLQTFIFFAVSCQH